MCGAGAGGTSLASPTAPVDGYHRTPGGSLMPLPHRPLGKTGVQVPILGYGTAPLGKIKLMDAPLIHKSARLLNHAIDKGITSLDPSPDYGSQPKLGEVMKARRDEVFLATKVNKRRKA